MEAVDRVEVVEVTSYCYEDNFCDVLVYQPQAQASEVVALLAEVAESLENVVVAKAYAVVGDGVRILSKTWD